MISPRLYTFNPGRFVPRAASESTIRRTVPGEFADDFFVGVKRIRMGQVGNYNPETGQNNPTLREAYKSTDATFKGFLPGGEDPAGLDKLVAVAVIAGGVLLLSQGLATARAFRD